MSHGDATRDRKDDAFDERLRDNLATARTQRDAQCGLGAARNRAGQHQVRDVGAGDQQHQAADSEQDLQTPAGFHRTTPGPVPDRIASTEILVI